MSSVHHGDLTPDQGIHVPYNWSYADSAERTGASGFTADDLYKLAFQEDDITLWMLTAITPTWIEITNSTGGTIVGPGSSTDNAIVRWDGTGATDIQNSTAIVNDDGSLEATVADAVTTGLSNALEIAHNSSGTPAATFGVGIQAKAETDTTANTLIGGLGWSWSDVVHASRRSGISFYAYDVGNLWEVGRIEASSYGSNVAGNARGNGAVDFSTFRGDASYVASGQDSTISGGGNNTASGYRSAIGGGAYNTAGGSYGKIGGGVGNIASANHTFVGGGIGNEATAANAAIAGGNNNLAAANSAFVGGGFDNEVSGNYSAILGGGANTISGINSVIAGGNSNNINGDSAAIAGGSFNEITGIYGFIGAGTSNEVSATYGSVINGGFAVARNKGQIVSSNGRFDADGDAQGIMQTVFRRQITHNTNAWSELYLDGSSSKYTIPSNTAMTFSVLIVGSTSGLGKTFAFKIEGAIENDGGTTALLGTPTVTTIYDTDDTSFDARVTADNTDDAILIEVSDSDGAGDTVRWVATLRSVELTYN